jgi:hypothetical protein
MAVLNEQTWFFNPYLLTNRACSSGSGFALVMAVNTSGFTFIRNENDLDYRRIR